MEFWPQYTYLALNFLGLGIAIANHGEPRTNESAITSIIATAITFSLLAAGGFFKGM